MGRFFAIITLFLTISLTGCNGPGAFPLGQSLDQHHFVSRPHLPMTIELKDTVTGEIVWKLDIPVDKEGIVRLDRERIGGNHFTGGSPATAIQWGIYDIGSGVTDDWQFTQELNGNPVMLNMVIRDAPESPPAETPVSTTPHPKTKPHPHHAGKSIPYYPEGERKKPAPKKADPAPKKADPDPKKPDAPVPGSTDKKAPAKGDNTKTPEKPAPKKGDDPVQSPGGKGPAIR